MACHYRDEHRLHLADNFLAEAYQFGAEAGVHVRKLQFQAVVRVPSSPTEPAVDSRPI